MTKEADVPPGGTNEGEEHPDRGALPRTIRTEKAENITPPNLKIQVVDGPALLEELTQVGGLNYRLGDRQVWVRLIENRFGKIANKATAGKAIASQE